MDASCHLRQHVGLMSGKKRKKALQVIWLAVVWNIWKSRNNRIFKGIVIDIEKIWDTSNGYQVSGHNLQLSSLYVEQTVLVGIDGPTDALKELLINGMAKRTVVSIVGMGGLGRTILARHVFNQKDVIDHFDCRAWLNASQSYKAEGVLKNLLKELYQEKK